MYKQAYTKGPRKGQWAASKEFKTGSATWCFNRGIAAPHGSIETKDYVWFVKCLGSSQNYASGVGVCQNKESQPDQNTKNYHLPSI